MAVLSNGSDLDLDSAWRPYSAMGRKQPLTYLSNDCVLVPHLLPASDLKMLVFLLILAAILLSGVPDYFYRNKISSGGDLSHYSSASLY